MSALLLAMAMLQAAPNPAPQASIERGLVRGLAYLAAAQADDGGWHSEVYGALRPGAAVTSLALYAIASAPEKIRRPHLAAAARAYRFLTAGDRQQNYVTNADGSPDYPTYATALALLSARRLQLGDADQRKRFEQFLLRMQIQESRRFAVESPQFGGWDLMGPSDPPEVTSGTNVSITRYVLDALQPVETKEAEAARQRASIWAKRLQQLSSDGGFPFTPDRYSESNKAGRDADQPLSYGTTTCDGLLCLLALAPEHSDEVKKAIVWLDDHFDAVRPPGFSNQEQGNTSWPRGLRFYYYSTLAEVLPHLPQAKDRSQLLAAAILAEQQADGRWENASSRMREDDPLIATSLAIIALSHLSDAAKTPANDSQP